MEKKLSSNSFKKQNKGENSSSEEETSPVAVDWEFNTENKKARKYQIEKPDETEFRYKMKGGQEIVLELDPKPGCGGHLWPSATALCEYVLNESIFPPGFWKDKKIIELGAGTGLVGLVLATLGAQVVITDMKALVDLISKNVSLNQMKEPQVSVKELDWDFIDSNPLKNENPPFDFIIASDCVYIESAFVPLIKTLCALSAPNTVTLLGSVKRRKGDKHFFTKARKCFKFTEIPQSFISPPVRAWSLTKIKDYVD